MIPDRYLELIHSEVDGLNRPDDSRTLQAYMSDHPEAQKLFDDLRRLDDVLGRVGMVEAPSGLKASILAALPAPPVEETSTEAPREARAERRSSWPSLRETLAALLAPRPMLAFAYTFAVGAVVGALLFMAADRNGAPAPEELVGAIGAESTAVQDAPLRLEADGVDGQVASSTRSGEYVLTFDVDADQPTDLLIRYDPSLWSMRGYRAASGAVGPEVDIAEGAVTLHLFARHRIEVMLSRRSASPEPLRLSFAREGEAFYDTTMTP